MAGYLGTDCEGPGFFAEELEFQLIIGGESWEVFKQSQLGCERDPLFNCPAPNSELLEGEAPCLVPEALSKSVLEAGQLGTDALALAAGGDGGGELRQQWKETGEASAAREEPYPGPPPAE